MVESKLTGSRLNDKLAEIRLDDERVRAWTALASSPEEMDVYPSGSLTGVTVGVKDVIDVAGFPTSYGSVAFKGEKREIDAASVRRLRDAGAIILGKLTTAELARRAPSATRNPLDLQRTPGGSSSGSAAAVAAGHVQLSLGTQTVGSVVRPASFCGVFGLVPSCGTIDRAGMLVNCRSVDTIGFFARDTLTLEGALRATNPSTPPVPIPGLELPVSIGFMKTDNWSSIERSAREILLSVVETLGCMDTWRISDFAIPIDQPAMGNALKTIVAFESARSLSGLYAGNAQFFSSDIHQIVHQGLGTSQKDYRDALRLRVRAIYRVVEAMNGIHAILAPAVLGIAPRGLGNTGDSRLSQIWSFLGFPCVAVPGLIGESGMPLGVQIIGVPGTEIELLRIASLLHDQFRLSQPKHGLSDVRSVSTVECRQGTEARAEMRCAEDEL